MRDKPQPWDTHGLAQIGDDKVQTAGQKQSPEYVLSVGEKLKLPQLRFFNLQDFEFHPSLHSFAASKYFFLAKIKGLKPGSNGAFTWRRGHGGDVLLPGAI